ncbi:MAG TPA: hypothetical protein VFX59_29560 [Polyangiales bacterium]|nr:hypothetical protein [Polyangiales bacterium]
MTSLRTLLMGSMLLLAACGDDEEAPVGNGALDASVPTGSTQTPDAATIDAATPPPAAESLYLIATSANTADETNLLLMTGKTLDQPSFDPSKALQFPGGGSVSYRDGFYYVAETEKQTITRYTFENSAFVKGPTLSLLGKGITYISAYFEVAGDSTRAFIISPEQLKIYEWNPTTMTLTTTHDLSALAKQGWGQEFRGSFSRSDGKLFLYWAYTNDRKDFINDFTLGVFDTKTNTVSKVLVDSDCPTTAGFGGYFDENEDLYLFADSFGLFTKFGGFPNPKDACILRIKKGSDELDPTFRLKPIQALGGREPWGLYYAGNGVAYTTAVDASEINKYASVFELIYAPVHSGWLIDTVKNTALEVKNVPPTGVGFESYRVDDRLLVPRSTGKVQIFDVEASQSTIYDIRLDGSATPLLSLPGDIAEITRIR